MGFVETLLQHTAKSESPRRYYYWAALSAIAGVVQNRVWFTRQEGQLLLYPNIYVLLVGRSGLRKGPPVHLARALVTAVDTTKVIAGRGSIEAIIDEIREMVTKADGGPPDTSSTAYLSASEFASFLVADPLALTQLTDLYDGHYNPDWTHRTRGHGKGKLEKVCINLFGASNEVHLKDALPENAIGGGFLARTFIIFADKKSHSDPGWTDGINTFPARFDEMVGMLKEISKAKGQFKYTKEAKEFYDQWYINYDKEDHSDDTTGTLERFHDHVVKVSMLVSLSDKPNLIITLDHVKEALLVCESFVPGNRRIGMGQTSKSLSAPGTAVLIKALLEAPDHTLLRSEALRKYWQHFDSFELDKIAESLMAQKAIRIRNMVDPEDGQRELGYELNPKIVERYKKSENN